MAGALLAQTWLWIGVVAAPIGYTVGLSGWRDTQTQFLLGGPPVEFAPAGNMTIRADPNHFEQDWSLPDGGGVHISEDIAPYSILFGVGPSHDELIAAVRTRSTWQETTALGGRINALRARIGRVSISIEGPLSYDDLFRIAESLRPGFAPLL
jgi:hypothetical protein